MKFVSEPPQTTAGRKGGRLAYQDEAEELRARPGEWGLLISHPVGDNKRSYAMSGQIRKNRYAAFRPAGAWEAVVRTADGETGLYVRYTGESE